MICLSYRDLFRYEKATFLIMRDYSQAKITGGSTEPDFENSSSFYCNSRFSNFIFIKKRNFTEEPAVGC